MKGPRAEWCYLNHLTDEQYVGLAKCPRCGSIDRLQCWEPCESMLMSGFLFARSDSGPDAWHGDLPDNPVVSLEAGARIHIGGFINADLPV